MVMSLLEIEKLNAGYGRKKVISDISLTLTEGQMVGIVGPNGSGKSTLIKAICRGIPSKGKLIALGQDIRKLSEREWARLCTYVPQRSGLAIEITALEAVLMGFHPYLGILERPGQDMRRKAEKLLVQLGLEEQINVNYMELSEGQKRLCTLARSLVTEASVFLLDEPDAALDFGARDRFLQILSEQLQSRKGGTLLAVHDINLALYYCDTIYLMKQGQIIGQIRPKEDATEEMEKKLSYLYGGVRLVVIDREQGGRSTVMVHV